MSGANFEVQSAQCRLAARDATGGMVFAASGSPRFVGASMAGAAIGSAIGSAIRENANYNDCMEARGWQIADRVPTQVAAGDATVTAPQPVVAAVPLPPPDAEARITGIRAMGVNPTLAAALKLDTPRGVYIAGVDRDGQPQPDGLMAGDVILRLQGARIGSMADMKRVMEATRDHTPLSAEVWRDERMRVVADTF
jgi:S1-C subfamily serine protease